MTLVARWSLLIQQDILCRSTTQWIISIIHDKPPWRTPASRATEAANAQRIVVTGQHLAAAYRWT
jgi:hypothetical protein